MREGIGTFGENNSNNSNLLNIYHNLKIAEECFRHLLSLLDGDGCEHHYPEYEIKEDRIDFECLVKLCSTNIELAYSINNTLIKQTTSDCMADHTCNTSTTRPKLNGRHHVMRTTRQPSGGGELNELFRESIVELMVLSVQCWEQCTHKSRIDLAEESRIWCVNVDAGRLRVRSMDRYLGINKLPKVPRWRDVIRTAYFVLDKVKDECSTRRQLEESLDHTLWIMRKLAL